LINNLKILFSSYESEMKVCIIITEILFIFNKISFLLSSFVGIIKTSFNKSDNALCKSTIIHIKYMYKIMYKIFYSCFYNNKTCLDCYFIYFFVLVLNFLSEKGTISITYVNIVSVTEIRSMNFLRFTLVISFQNF